MTETIQGKIDETRKNLNNNKDKLEQLRIERAELAIENSKKHKATIDRFDEQIDETRKNIENAPVELRILEEQLTAEHDRMAQEQREQLCSQQKEIVCDVEKLSKKFIELLKQANYANEQLRSALTAEAGIRKKTGQVFLEQYCHGSQQSLSMLLETMQDQMQGQHTIPAEQLGMVGSNVPVRL